jgi:toxin ParE1/3/4
MSRYVLNAPARQDLKDIKNYLVRFSLGATSRFIDAFEEKCRLLVDFPEMGRTREELAANFRSLPVDKYVIFTARLKMVSKLSGC